MIIDPASIPAANAYKILIGAIVPRPIGFISTVSSGGVFNLAPFSFFNGVCGDPPVVCFAPNARTPRKDTLVNIQATGEFVVNIVSEEIAEQMNLCSGNYPPEVDEFRVSGLTPVASDIVRPPRVLESHVNMECKALQVIEVSTRPWGGSLVLGEVVRFHVDDAIIDSRFRIDPDKLRAIGRMGGTSYTRTRDRFDMIRPA
ncbi:MAG TPA: flavin reductase family protein [Bryobacteraceae bacterium]|nr:flavin reductase family protein [Bryobacteraceae bacterium]